MITYIMVEIIWVNNNNFNNSIIIIGWGDLYMGGDNRLAKVVSFGATNDNWPEEQPSRPNTTEH